MNKIKFNNEVELQVESYNKNTYFNNNTMNTTANCSVITDDIAALHALANDKITSIIITCNDNVIYNLSNIDAKIENINEYLSGERMYINVNLTFVNI